MVGAHGAPADRAHLGTKNVRLLRIVPDNTNFDFIRFRRVSFPVSALLSILAIVLYFTHGLNFGIDFIGGTLIEVQSKAGPADIAKMRTTLNELGLGEVQLQEFGGPENVLIRLAQQPGGEQAQQAITQCLQIHGGLGYMDDHWTSRFYRDARALTIAAGTPEVMKEMIAAYMRV